MNSQMCPQCRASVSPGQWLCPECGTDIPEVDVERTVLRPPATGSKPVAPPSAAGLITSVPSSGAVPPSGASRAATPPTWSPIASTQAPVDPLVQPTFLAQGRTDADVAAPAPDASQKWLPRAAVALAVVGFGLFVWKLTSGGDETAGPESNSVTVETSIPTEPTIAIEATAVETTVDATVATTVPPTDPPVASPPRPPWLPPQVPEPPVFVGPGMAWSVSDPLASGMNKDQPTPYLLFAEDVFNKMAADDWAGVQPSFLFQLPDGQVVPYAFELQNQWPAADRLSLILIDAVPDPTGLTGYDLTVAVVANFPASTSVLCGHLYSDPTTSLQVIQRGQFSLMADGLLPTMPESLLNDPAQIEFLKGCK